MSGSEWCRDCGRSFVYRDGDTDPKCKCPFGPMLDLPPSIAAKYRAIMPARGVPAYHPTDHQPVRCGGTET